MHVKRGGNCPKFDHPYYVMKRQIYLYFIYLVIEISQYEICGGECDSCKF